MRHFSELILFSELYSKYTATIPHTSIYISHLQRNPYRGTCKYQFEISIIFLLFSRMDEIADHPYLSASYIYWYDPTCFHFYRCNKLDPDRNDDHCFGSTSQNHHMVNLLKDCQNSFDLLHNFV